ncbi:phosphate acyltransferase PlsX [uncultured Fusobacterium sp.]|jgi:glycerol-3-phosphate acyltransferase PlsX|uniref:phosphate acyltransferase PlsX n=1 Tax=uncultured Fusobacterium sp. TaxID=159267 RepID=UPI0025D1CECB|nr:phosphate acyltransferase PlsX [uncultured Fusobacterium sp.]
MKIALDAMGGDNAPLETIKGAVAALEEVSELELVLVGKKEVIEAELSKYKYNKEKIEIVDAREIIEMTDEPVVAVKSKKDSSMNRTLELVKDGTVNASVSAGNTGALITASQLKLKRIKGVLRPAIATMFPNKKGHMLMLDVGATADCKPEFLNQYAMMGSKYMEILLGRKDSKVGLLNIGTEEGKGNEVTREAYNLLKENKSINFVGNVESTEVMNGNIDVVVTDGFTGNMVLKTAEGIGKFILDVIKTEVSKSFIYKLGALLLMPALKVVKSKMDSSEYGGAIFLGLNGISIKAHGNSDAVAIKNAIKVAEKFAKLNFVEEMKKVIDIDNIEVEEK